MNLNSLLVVLGVVAVAVVPSCGSSSSETCGSVAACGGDVVGTWNIVSSCVRGSAETAGCPDAKVINYDVDISGTMTFNADLTYTTSAKVDGTATVVMPASCLMSQGLTLSCAQLNEFFAAAPTAGVTVHCTGTSGCTCMETIVGQQSMSMGTYTTTSAGLLTQTKTPADASDTPDVSDYCVKGNTLTASPHSGSTPMGAEVTGSITLTKR